MEYRKFTLHQKTYLIKINECKILFGLITKDDVENSHPHRYIYVSYQGEITNDIISGIIFNYSDGLESDLESYTEYENKLSESGMITEKELLPLLPVSVYGDYTNPFKTLE